MAVRERVRHTYERVRPWVPAVFFIGGFAWDALTLGQKIKSVDLFIILAYLAGAAAILVALGRGIRFRGSPLKLRKFTRVFPRRRAAIVD